MDTAEQDQHSFRDDRAWPRWAGPFSLLLGLGAVAFAIAVTVSAEQQLAPALALLAGLLGGSSLMIVPMRRGWPAEKSATTSGSSQ